MKRIIIMLIAIFCMLLAHMLPLVNSASAAGLVVSSDAESGDTWSGNYHYCHSIG